MSPFFRQVFLGKNCRYRADGYAGSAVDAVIGKDVELRRFDMAGLVPARMNDIYRASVDARCIFDSDARFGDHNLTPRPVP